MKSLSREEIEKEYEIIKACRAKPAYFEYFYNRYFRDIFYFVYRRVSDEPLAEDLTAEVFLKALQKIDQFKEKGFPFSAWLYRIAMNEVNMFYRRTRKEVHLSIERDRIKDFTAEAEVILTDENLELLEKALGGLPEKELRMVELRFFEKMSFKEIGIIFGMTENNAKVKVYRIVERIKKHFP